MGCRQGTVHLTQCLKPRPLSEREREMAGADGVVGSAQIYGSNPGTRSRTLLSTQYFPVLSLHTVYQIQGKMAPQKNLGEKRKKLRDDELTFTVSLSFYLQYLLLSLHLCVHLSPHKAHQTISLSCLALQFNESHLAFY